MKRRLLDLIVCPGCRSSLVLDAVFREEGDEVLDGALVCERCDASFPVVAGVPRLLAPALLARMRGRYPEFFERHPRFLPAGSAGDATLADTLESFTRQRLDFQPPGPEVASQWHLNFARNLGTAIHPTELRDKLVLDVGCGFGRHLYCASERGAEVVGVDLSGGVDRAFHNNRGHAHCHVVQANLFDRPFRDRAFDLVFSFGVLHHLSDPHAGFRAMVPFAKRDGGIVAIWVYGYRGMALTYRLSHMRPLHRITRELDADARVRASKAVAAVLSAFYWGPLAVASRLGFRRQVERLPLSAYVTHDWSARVAAVHDRLSTPITHFHDRPELLAWFRDAGLVDIRVEDTDRRGWRAHGAATPQVDGRARHDERVALASVVSA